MFLRNYCIYGSESRKQREIWTHTQKIKPCDDRGNYLSDMSTRHRMPTLEFPEAREWQGRIFPRPFNGSLALRHLDFKPLISRTKSQYISFILSYPACGTLLWKPFETRTLLLSPWLSYHNLRGWGMMLFQFCMHVLGWKSSDSTFLWFHSVPPTPNPTPLLSRSITVRTVLLQKPAEILCFKGSYRLFQTTSVLRIWLYLCEI